ncbi:MAG: asparagine synthase (glutamine-hydrolyzing) [Lachnospiraceae bacterium]|nr:asparagine synthase (glutamine-hydrolyzing) [Lachnospiraceae bacterium]
MKDANFLNLINEPQLKSKSGRYLLNLSGKFYNHDCEKFLDIIENNGLKEALNSTKGKFSLAVYDTKERTVYLARDRVGEKSLYYGFVNGTFVFCPELNQIKAIKGFNNPINTDILTLYFTYGYIPAPYSIYRDIHKLDAGNILEIKEPFKESIIYPYWSIKDVASYGQSNLFKGGYPEAVDELERLLKKAIGEQMAANAPANAPAGVFLSAGIDSSTTAALMQSISAEKIKSFTIGMPAGGKDESVYAKKIAAHLGLEHIEHFISEQEAIAIIPLLGKMFGEPFADSSQIPTYLVSKIAKEQVPISLGGDAGDELFCGYNLYRSIDRFYRKLNLIPPFVRRPLKHLLLNGPIPLSPKMSIRAKLLDVNPTQLVMNLFDYDPFIHQISLTDVDVPYKYSEIEPYFLPEINHQLMLMDMLMYTPDDILVKVDRAASFAALDVRAPMLDKDVIEFAFSLPINYKRNKKEGKLILRDILYRYVPRELMERPKQGFSVPIEKWLKGPLLRDWAEQLLSRDTLLRQGLLNPDTVHQIWDSFILRDQFKPQLWYILMFQSFMLSE